MTFQPESYGISIIVCCYNSALRLNKTLECIALQKVPDDLKWEVIIVDNNSTDSTSLIAESEWKKYNLAIPFKIVAEKKQGLSYARKTGVENAAYSILVFCDDDNHLKNNYISHAYEIMQVNSNIGIAGGQSLPDFETEKPFWFNKFEYAYAVGKQLQQTGIANQRKYLTGAGIVIRKEIFSILDEIGFTSMLSDRKGNSVSSGGDSEICLLALFLGYDLYYDEALQFTHFIPTNRLQWRYCVKMITKGFAYPQIYFAMYDYCFKGVTKNEVLLFNNLYRWNMRRQLRIIRNEFVGFDNFFKFFLCLFFSRSGNEKEIRVKTAVNKLAYLFKNKIQLAVDFNTILDLSRKILQIKNGSSNFMQSK